MSFIPSVFIVFLCLSMHACIARHFGSVKVGGRVKQKIAMEPPVEGIIRGSIVENIDGAVMNTHHESKTDSKIVRGSSGGDKPSSSSFIMVSLKATNIEGSTRRKRLSVVRFGSIDLNNSHKVHEDAEVIDYDPPHRTPPIHNRKI
ncbi:uncharacterized protein LOC110600419 [Manihot esculenta]|uniref:Uncharacterized protein n=2 Tax=Manihot esculenta TaxID=3983 RepID=A0A2C9UI57_MANES|nr:uncharacterized protein LOC110600419 [Manihot esculenta]KAG8638497.1 hypothetical protein MANES_14G035700v8 [Manihot esculenta]OAY30499.1 hypothetical protein MANES_14G035700v8 [Manihot esculenta]